MTGPLSTLITHQTTSLSIETSSAHSDHEDDDEQGTQLLFVSCYSDFERLAHGPRGTQAKHPIYVYRLNDSDGSMVLMNVTGDPKDVINPAFTRFHPRLNVVYTCTEDIAENGKIIAYTLDNLGNLIKISEVDAGGTSTCYLTIDRGEKNLIAVNYWDSTIVVIPISYETGEFTGPIQSRYDPKGGMKVIAAAKKDGGVNHSHNDETTIQMRQKDPHSHALVLDPYFGRVAYVPCLGKDVIREFLYDKENGSIQIELNSLPSGLRSGHADGPRYLVFHPLHDMMYVVNELSSTVAVFTVNKALLREINDATKAGESMDRFRGQSTLKLVQSIRTIPPAFPTKLNTCGRICLHPSGRFVLVSNRGHQSLAVLRVRNKGSDRGLLSNVGFFHTRGETPRHFSFDTFGQYLLVANQDTDNISIFTFNQSTGEIQFTGNEYRVPSPNFICCCPIVPDRGQENEDLVDPVTGIRNSLQGISINSPEDSLPVKSNNTDREELEKKLNKYLEEVERLKKQLSIL